MTNVQEDQTLNEQQNIAAATPSGAARPIGRLQLWQGDIGHRVSLPDTEDRKKSGYDSMRISVFGAVMLDVPLQLGNGCLLYLTDTLLGDSNTGTNLF